MISFKAIDLQPDKQREQMEFSPYRIIDSRQFAKPCLEIDRSHSRVATFLAVPIDGIDRIVGRKLPMSLASMLVDRPERPHGPVRDIGPILLGDGVVLPRDAGGIDREFLQRYIQPVFQNAFKMALVASIVRSLRLFQRIWASRYRSQASLCVMVALLPAPSIKHWKHLRTTNPTESTFATVRHRTIRSKGCLSNGTALAMVFKPVEGAPKSWRSLDGHNQLSKLVLGVTFNDGIEVIASRPTVSP